MSGDVLRPGDAVLIPATVADVEDDGRLILNLPASAVVVAPALPEGMTADRLQDALQRIANESWWLFHNDTGWYCDWCVAAGDSRESIVHRTVHGRPCPVTIARAALDALPVPAPQETDRD